ncbi:unnamed protein product (macronuclear) [Paramecium tetraurelia]|uniref:Uncharacterized protein n=1 Tax=Paramecium tetraurelia TaxID=5888 RepID=A0CA25_PARTE|nr:uncharacterized protein GSPATT00036421001 [Paramecium tetraurelia]CAK67642.1 unnamed protein product [Paramecium tetraurelia]|eukprot:XP_001435039.1 hypothetical protein (macronuclear) [Paramecium tetraurelia strain d4-2]
MYTKFNHRPVQEFAYQRKPKIKVLTKLGFQELMKLQSNPVQFEEQEDLTLRNYLKQGCLDPFTKKYRSQINLWEKLKQVENEGIGEEEIQEFNEFEIMNKEHPYLLRNHAYPLQEEYQEPLKLPQIQTERYQKSNAPKIWESSLFSGERVQLKRRKQKRQEAFKLAGSLSILRNLMQIEQSSQF